MSAVNRSFFLLFTILLFGGLFAPNRSNAQTNFLKEKISIHANKKPVGEVLKEIEQKGGFIFSYNTARINENELVSINADEISVAKSLDILFNKRTNYKVLGRHVVLIPSDLTPWKSDTSPTILRNYISGKITNADNGRPVPNATILLVNGKSTALSDSMGTYELTIGSTKEIRGFSFSKAGFRDSILMITTIPQHSVDIELTPQENLKTISGNGKHLKLVDLHERNIVASLVPQKSKLTSDNLTIFDRTKGQISLLPFLGTNLNVSGAVTNTLSINLIAGYNGGVNGVELGGAVNIVRRDVAGVQLAGFTNFVGGNTKYVQAAGFFNKNGGNVKGVQLAGFSNVVLDTITGVQAAGFQNTLHGHMRGLQISGFNNVTTKNVDGLQITGFANVALKDVKIAQLSGFLNYARNVKGLQLSGLANIASENVDEGQIAALGNIAKKVNGLQNAGLFNLATREVEGIQMAGFFNYTKKLKGLQLGIFNYADTIENGFPVGALSFVRKGFHRTELYTSEAFGFNASMKLGVKKFYNAIRFGHDFENTHYWGYGLGTFMQITSKVSLEMGLNHDLLFMNSAHIGSISQAFLGTDIKLFPAVAIFLGPTLNFSYLDKEGDLPKISFVNDAFLQEMHGDKFMEGWFGWHAGLAIEF